MKVTHNGKRYNTDNCEIIATRDHYNYNNNYSGVTQLLRAKDGEYLEYTKANGQDLHLRTGVIFPDCPDIDGYDLTEEQEKRASELKLIEIV